MTAEKLTWFGVSSLYQERMVDCNVPVPNIWSSLPDIETWWISVRPQGVHNTVVLVEFHPLLTISAAVRRTIQETLSKILFVASFVQVQHRRQVWLFSYCLNCWLVNWYDLGLRQFSVQEMWCTTAVRVKTLTSDSPDFGHCCKSLSLDKTVAIT